MTSDDGAGGRSCGEEWKVLSVVVSSSIVSLSVLPTRENMFPKKTNHSIKPFLCHY
jgi:hypothetical protein